MTTDKPNLIDTDFKAAALAAGLIDSGKADADEIVILPQGSQQRAYAKEIALVSNYQSAYRNRQVTAIHIHREGLYDMLPEGLFHEPPASSVMVTEEEMIRDIKTRREEEKQARNFFAPFETGLYHLRTIIELYENRVDKKDENDELVNIFLKEWKEFKCFTNKQMVILIHVLPVIHEQRNNLPFIGNILNIMFGVNFDLQYQLRESRPGHAPILSTGSQLGAGQLGVNLIAGSYYEAEEELRITVGPLTAAGMLSFLPGTRQAEALDVLLNYFIPLQSTTHMNYVVEPEHQQMVLGNDAENACLGFTTYLNN